MKNLIKKTYFTLILSIFLFQVLINASYASKKEYSKYIISNYFSGIVSLNYNNENKAFEHLNKVQYLKARHANYNIQFIHTLILLEKFDQAFKFSKSIWKENEFFFEIDLLLGLEAFINKDYISAENHFKRLSDVSEYNVFLETFLGDFLLSWVEAAKQNKDISFNYINQNPNRYKSLKKIQNVFLQCYFNDASTKKSFENLINNKDFTFSRYNFFLINYLVRIGNEKEAKKIIDLSRQKYNSNLLLKQSEDFILNENSQKILDFFNCESPKDSIAELLYIIANLYSSEQDYQLSNFYLKISLFLNEKFETNRALLAENFYYQEKYELSKKMYNLTKQIGSVYSWHASKSIATILLDTKNKKESISSLEKDFKSLPKPNFEHYYELANFYKENEYYDKSIKYYSLALENIKKNHSLIPKILDRRGTSYERSGQWKKAEKDLLESLSILPDQAHVLNYLAYSWVEKGINVVKALEMLEKATALRENDGYIIDSLGWAHYMNQNYIEAEKFLQKAVELRPLDPVINDHYADSLWMLNKNIQARHVWNHVLNLDSTEKELKDKISMKLIFGLTEKL
tara:strand:+ start:434 stop:2152 length:1719 start_codon:yes stop_codon:yes gene_type:complete